MLRSEARASLGPCTRRARAAAPAAQPFEERRFWTVSDGSALAAGKLSRGLTQPALLSRPLRRNHQATPLDLDFLAISLK